jgi:hypothetical protein
VFRRRSSEPSVPVQDEVVDRVLCIAVTTMLGAVVANLRGGALDDERAARYAAESHRWLRRENLADSLSGAERALVAKSPADWSEKESIDADWRNESLGALLWAISAVGDMPPYDERFQDLPSRVPLLAPTAGFRRAASLRPPDELERAREIAELWHRRSRTTQPRSEGGPQAAGSELDAIACQSAALAHAAGSIPEPIDGDFPAYGKAYRDLAAGECSEAGSIARERHYALNWLSGSSSDWDSVPTGT